MNGAISCAKYAITKMKSFANYLTFGSYTFDVRLIIEKLLSDCNSDNL